MIVRAKHHAIEEFKKSEDSLEKVKLEGKINGLNVAIDILADKY